MALFAEMFDKHMKAIGVISVRWSSIDNYMYKILGDRLLLKAEATEFRYKNAGRKRLDYFKKLINCISHLPLEEKIALTASIDRLIELYSERNLIVHGQYGMLVADDNTLSPSYSDIKLRVDEPSVGRMEPAPVMVDDLLQHADAVSEAAKPLTNFLYQRPKMVVTS